ncbi:MAG: tetratricopeptide repeat protein, partial [Gammaproteobacteria bacterium]|nr:tetratricopeptide repeat protein [Gammaproteobacteria bacterium]
EDAIAHVARQRLARVLLARGEADAALELVESEDAPGFQSAYSEIRGDIYVSQGKQMQARQAYQLAIENQPEGASNPILEMKLSDLPLQASVLQGDDGRDSLEALVTAPVEAVTEDAVAEETAAEEVAAEEATPDVEEKADSAESSNGSGS